MIKDIIGVNRVSRDTYYNNVTTLIKGDAPADATTTDYNGYAALSSLSGAGNWTESLYAGYFDGASYLTTTDVASGFKLSSTSFTIEAWVYCTASASESIIVSKWNTSVTAASNQWLLYLANLTPTFIFSTDGTNIAATATGTTLTLNQWYHVAAVRNGSNFNVYVNGVAGATVVNAGALYNLETEVLGVSYRRNNGTTIGRFNGYISNLRIVKGQALYAQNFTPPTSSLTLTTNGGATPSTLPTAANVWLLALRDNNIATTKQASILSQLAGLSNWTGSLYAGYFINSSQCNVAYNAQLNMQGATNFTIELWYYPLATNGTRILLSKDGVAGSQNSSYGLAIQDGYLQANVSDSRVGDIVSIITSNTLINIQQWTHIAMVKNGTTLRIYQNGVQVATQTGLASIVDSGDPLYINGERDSAPRRGSGYISNLRIVKGQALYTQNFTPPTSNLTTTTNGGATPSTLPTAANVSLLACTTSNLLYDGSPTAKTITIAAGSPVATQDDSNSLTNFTTSGAPQATNNFSNPYTRKNYNNQNDLFSNEIVALTSIAGAGSWTESLYAGYFDGGSYLTVPASTDFTLAGDFTIECWVNTSVSAVDTNTRHIISMGTGADAANLLKVGLFTTGGTASNVVSLYTNSAILVGNIIVADGRWHHVAVVRSGGNSLRLYVDGVQSGSTITNTQSFNAGATTNVQIGRFNNAETGRFSGYISNLRIVIGQAIYTQTFTPPTARLSTSSNGGATPSVNPVPINVKLLSLQTASVYYDNAFAQKTISRTGDVTMTQYQTLAQVGKVAAARITPWSNNVGYWGGYFNGSSALSLADDSSLELGTSNFTIEAWINPATLGTTKQIISKDNNTGVNSGNLAFYANTSNKIIFLCNPNSGNTTGQVSLQSTTNITPNNWMHVAASRNGNNWYLFVNGVQEATTTSSVSFRDSTALAYIGASLVSSAVGEYWNGYISNLRIVKGQALYTSAFTPSTIPLTTTTNGNAVGATTTPAASAVSLMTLQNSKFVDNSSTPKTLTVAGTPKSQTPNPFTKFRMQKTAFNSGWFDGASYLTAPASTSYTLSGDFTIECWVNTSVFSLDTQARHIISMGTGADAANLLKLIFYTTVAANVVTIYTNSAILQGNIVVADGGWHHVAVVRSGGNSLRLYVDGVQSGSTITNTQSFNAGATTNVQIGRFNNAETGRFNGYLANLRIVNGTAVYTGAFTPPIAPVQTSGAASATSYSSTNNVNTSFAASQCSLLLDFDDAGVMDSSGNTAISTYFEARTSEAQSKWTGKQSLYFDGTNYMTYVPLNNFGTGDFTVEAWVWQTDAATNWYIVDARNSAQTTNWVFGQGSAAGRLSWYNGTAWSVATTTQVTTSSAWNHIMYTRSNNIGMMYCNGVRVASAADATNYSVLPTSSFIGASYVNTINFNGYLDDLRITTGVARATGPTYTVPSKPAATK